MSQPPYPPQGGNEPSVQQPGQEGRGQVPQDQPTQRFDQPDQYGQAPGGRREETTQFPPPGQYPPPSPPQYGQAGQYGQPDQYGQLPYWQPGRPDQYGQPLYGPPPYGQPSYGQPSYGEPGRYGQPQYGQRPYGQPGPFGQEPQKSNTSTVIALTVAGAIMLVVIAVALIVLVGRGGDGSTASSSTTSATRGSSSSSASSEETSTDGGMSSPGDAVPPATEEPTGLGSDSTLNQLAQSCYDGDMTQCDLLYLSSVADDSLGAYTSYADTCAGRQPENTERLCTETFPS